MKKTSKTIVFFGNERLATGVTTSAPTLRALVDAGYHVAAVVSSFSTGQSRNQRHLEIEQVALQHNIPLLLPQKITDLAGELKALDATAGVLVAYGKIIPQSIIDIFPAGIINIHPSLLPLHRGPTPIESVILAGDHKTGVSLMQLAKAMDAGPVYAQETLRLKGDESKQTLADNLLQLGAQMLVKHLPAILNGTLQPIVQNNDEATYDSLLQKDSGVIDWRQAAVQIVREIRAYSGWPKSRTQLMGKEVIITQAHSSSDNLHPDPTGPKPFRTSDGLIGIPSLTDGVVIIDRLVPIGKKEMSTQEFLAGYGKHI